MPLTDTAIRNSKSNGKLQKLTDGGGLYLQVNPNGSRWWRFRYRYQGKEQLLSLGIYADVSLKLAREKRDHARRQLAEGVNPSAARKNQRAEAQKEATSSFEAVAREWFGKHAPNWAPTHASRIIMRLQNDVFPILGKVPIGEIIAPQFLEVLRRIEARGKIETAHRVRQSCGQVFRYAIATGRAARDVSADLKGALPPVKERHHPSITDPKEIGALLRAIDGYTGWVVAKAALKLAPLVFVRPGALRRVEWSEIDFKAQEWRIPAEKMKLRRLHIVPLSRQSLKILRELQPHTGQEKYLFPGIRMNGRPMSVNTVNAVLRQMGYEQDEMTGHGFRSMAATRLNEKGYNRDWIERQMAHAEKNSVRAAYNFAEYLKERRIMMQEWADHLDGLKGESIKAVPSDTLELPSRAY
ncbi:MAG: tyrosine-type recombinase/integrase [Candidatus Omnitrophica bacterium]|nr:tyrosine-type recombinase/integrase [Candidatus Omnitrophota bacterium]